MGEGTCMGWGRGDWCTGEGARGRGRAVGWVCTSVHVCAGWECTCVCVNTGEGDI